MQSSTHGLSLICLAFPFALAACGGPAGDRFDEAIRAAKESKAHEVSVAKRGLPFYSSPSLDPIWDGADPRLVRIPKLSLTAQDGKVRDESLFDNRISFVGFFFASCHGFCPVLIQNMSRIESVLPRDPRIKFVGITVDPEDDTPAVLRAYAKRSRIDTAQKWTLLTGDRKVIYDLARDTFAGQAFRRTKNVQPGERNFVHSEHIYVLDGQRRLRAVLNGTRVNFAEDSAKIVTFLLDEASSADSEKIRISSSSFTKKTN